MRGDKVSSNPLGTQAGAAADHPRRLALPALPRPVWLGLQLIAFQLAWFACVLGAARGTPGWGIAAVALVVGLQLLGGAARRVDALLVLLAMAAGLAWDTGLTRLCIVEYASPGPVPGLAPGWILALWALFATTLREPLRWLHGRAWLAALVGGVGGALSYWGAVRLGAGRFPDFALAMGVLAAGWALITPALVACARRLSAGLGRRPAR
jgi:hypothetical protein